MRPAVLGLGIAFAALVVFCVAFGRGWGNAVVVVAGGVGAVFAGVLLQRWKSSVRLTGAGVRFDGMGGKLAPWDSIRRVEYKKRGPFGGVVVITANQKQQIDGREYDTGYSVPSSLQDFDLCDALYRTLEAFAAEDEKQTMFDSWFLNRFYGKDKERA